MRAASVASALAQRAEDVARLLMPNGKRDGQEWRVGSLGGESGQSLGIRLAGDKAGRWKDFNAGNSGDLLDLWTQVRGIDLQTAILEACDYLGIRDHTAALRKPEWQTPDKPACQRPRAAVRDWLMQTRGLSDATLTAYQLAEQGNAVIFPSLRNGKLIRWKSRDITDRKKIHVSPDCEPCLFGWQAIRADARAVVICEGEIDACSWYQLGYPALSVPNGAQGTTWIDADYDNLERFDTIYLSFDNDEAGRKGVAAVVDRLGRERCHVVQIPDPYKDANDLLRAGYDVAPLLLTARTQDPDQLRYASDYLQEVIAEFNPAPGEIRGFLPPWKKADKLAFRYGELVILGGQNGHGKSEVAGHLTLAALAQGERACVASMEFKPRKWLARLTRQACTIPDPTVTVIESAHDWYSGRLWVFDAQGNADTAQMLEVFRYARNRYDVRLFVVDNLAKCGFAEDAYNDQKKFVDQLTDFARDTDSVVLLCVHMRKAQDETHIGGKHDVKGTGAITDMADTVLSIWRNKKKEADRREAEDSGISFNEAGTPDTLLICDKQRNGDDEPRIGLWFEQRSHQFVEFANQFPHRYVKL